MSKDTYHRRVRGRIHTDPDFNLHSVLLAPIAKADMSTNPKQGMKIITGQSYDEAERNQTQIGAVKNSRHLPSNLR